MFYVPPWSQCPEQGFAQAGAPSTSIKPSMSFWWAGAFMSGERATVPCRPQESEHAPGSLSGCCQKPRERVRLAVPSSSSARGLTMS